MTLRWKSIETEKGAWLLPRYSQRVDILMVQLTSSQGRMSIHSLQVTWLLGAHTVAFALEISAMPTLEALSRVNCQNSFRDFNLNKAVPLVAYLITIFLSKETKHFWAIILYWNLWKGEIPLLYSKIFWYSANLSSFSYPYFLSQTFSQWSFSFFLSYLSSYLLTFLVLKITSWCGSEHVFWNQIDEFWT